MPWFPFLTAMNSAEETAVMLSEMASVGGTMAIWLTVIWVGMCLVADNLMKLHVLCYLYWGASLMWMIDAVFEYVELGAEFFAPAPVDMLNDFYLGLSVVALGMIIWIVYLLVKDPKGVVRAALTKK